VYVCIDVRHMPKMGMGLHGPKIFACWDARRWMGCITVLQGTYGIRLTYRSRRAHRISMCLNEVLEDIPSLTSEMGSRLLGFFRHKKLMNNAKAYSSPHDLNTQCEKQSR
jgi:hypothetical protein